MATDSIQLESPAAAASAGEGLHADLDLVLTSRRPARLAEATFRAAVAATLPDPSPGALLTRPASIVVVTHNNFAFTKLCLVSLLSNTAFPGYELIVVDNGSTDDTPDLLRGLAARSPHVRAICNADNRGFAAANNQGLALAGGEAMVLLNNDTLVPPGWLCGLLAHLEDSAVGAVCPVTNRTCNEAQIDTRYETYGQFLRFTADRTSAHAGQTTDIPMLPMFCLAMRRDVHEKVGPLDERFELGLFEDDDYSLRVRAAGYQTVCAEDVFVHHFGEASFGGLTSNGGYAGVFGANRRRFEEKWGVTWRPHGRRVDPRRDAERAAVQRAVQRATPPGATVAVVSKGDEELVALEGRQGWHFPRSADGGYAGFYPGDSASAVEHLEALRSAGAEYLVFPASAAWWLEHYAGLRSHLESSCRRIGSAGGECLIFVLNVQPKSRPRGRVPE
ncbi:MAG: putative glycosyltransferase [Phycisphaerales bacterium]|nr:putative glycosyltransferase [Phycisphaerales bacterium]